MSRAHNTLNTPSANKTVFACDSGKAQAVYLAGSFNDWNPAATPMVLEGSHHWAVAVPLPAGRHEYKFVVDGEWCCEPDCTALEVRCTNCVMNEFGTMNRVIEVVES